MWKLTLNKFPYFFEDDVKNFVLWYGNKYTTKSEKEEWMFQCEEFKHCDLIVFENMSSLKSLNLISHLQIMARKTKNSEKRKIMF